MKYVPIIVIFSCIYILMCWYYNDKENKEEHKRKSS